MTNASKRDQYEEVDIFTLEFDDGEAFEAGVMCVFELGDKTYMALERLDDGVDEVYLYEYICSDDDYDLVDIPAEKFGEVEAAFEEVMNS